MQFPEHSPRASPLTARRGPNSERQTLAQPGTRPKDEVALIAQGSAHAGGRGGGVAENIARARAVAGECTASPTAAQREAAKQPQEQRRKNKASSGTEWIAYTKLSCSGNIIACPANGRTPGGDERSSSCFRVWFSCSPACINKIIVRCLLRSVGRSCAS